jgi:hypothetical protein
MAAATTTTTSTHSKLRTARWSALGVAAAVATGSIIALSLGDSAVGPSEATQTSSVLEVQAMSANAAEHRLDGERLGVQYLSANAAEYRLGHQ